MRISVITPSFNLVANTRTDQFKRAVQSVVDQTYHDIEHIVIDGGSTDGTVELIEAELSAGRITRYISSPDSGIYQALNRGIELATGAYFMVLPSDDFYRDARGLERIAQIGERTSPALICSSIRVASNPPRLWHASPLFRTIYSGMPYGHIGMAMKRDTVRELGSFDERFKIAGDYDLVFKIMIRGLPRATLRDDFSTFTLGGTSSDHAARDKERAFLLKNNLAPLLGIEGVKWPEPHEGQAMIPNRILFRVFLCRKIGRQMRFLALMQLLSQTSPRSLQRLFLWRPWRRTG